MMRFAFYEKLSDFSTQKYFPKKINFMTFFRAMPCQYFSVPRFSVPCRAKIFRAMIFRAVPCHESAGPPFRAVPGRPCLDELAQQVGMNLFASSDELASKFG